MTTATLAFCPALVPGFDRRRHTDTVPPRNPLIHRRERAQPLVCRWHVEDGRLVCRWERGGAQDPPAPDEGPLGARVPRVRAILHLRH